MMRYNWKNLPFDLQHRKPVSEPEEDEGVHEDEEEDLDRYIHDEEGESNEEVAEEAIEVVTADSVIQVDNTQD